MQHVILPNQDWPPGHRPHLQIVSVPCLRPLLLTKAPPNGYDTFMPDTPVVSDCDAFATIVRRSKKGPSAGLWGWRYEYFKFCLEDDHSFDALCPRNSTTVHT
eukprot:5726981-Pyramimonas_sp.AAC.1